MKVPMLLLLEVLDAVVSVVDCVMGGAVADGDSWVGSTVEKLTASDATPSDMPTE